MCPLQVSLIATGMCIDYTAHGGHAFFAAWREHTEKKEEERKERREQRRRRREEEGEYGPDDEGDEDDLRKQKSMADEVLRETLALIRFHSATNLTRKSFSKKKGSNVFGQPFKMTF